MSSIGSRFFAFSKKRFSTKFRWPMCDNGKVVRASINLGTPSTTNLSISYPIAKIGSFIFSKIWKWVLTQKCHFSVTPKKVPISANMGPILDFRLDIESEGLSFLCQIQFQKIIFFSLWAFGQKSKFHFFRIYPWNNVLRLIFWLKRV